MPGHRFADLSEHGFGVALLTDCKYGYSSCYGNEMRISLLRSPTEPDPQADIGRHEFAYARAAARRRLARGRRGRRGGALQRAAALGAGAAVPGSFASVDDPNLVLDTVKRAEDSDALVLRLYEAHGARGTARLRVGVPFADGASRATCSRIAGEPLEMDGDEIVLAYRPHEIVSVLVR